MMAEWLASIGTWNLTLAEKRVAWSPGLYRIAGSTPRSRRPTSSDWRASTTRTTATA